MKLLALVVSLAVVASAWGCGGGSGSAAGSQEMPDPLAGVAAQDLFARGRAYLTRGDSIRAEQYLTAAIDRGYPEREAMPLVIRACVASARLSSALGYAEPYLSRHPGDWSLRYLVATLHQGLGHFDRARHELEQVMHDAPEASEPVFALALLLKDDLSDAEAARPLFERYLELAPHGSHVEQARAALAPPITRVERAPIEIHRDAGTSDEEPVPTESPIPNLEPAGGPS